MAQTFMFADDGVVPNNPVFPVVVIAATVLSSAVVVRAIYRKNGPGGVWEYTVNDDTHYHPDAHEVLTCIQGWGDVHFGGESGRDFCVTSGDCIVLPAGTGHRRIDSSSDFLVAGTFPPGQENPETCTATKRNHAGMPERISQVSMPLNCPIQGPSGATIQAW